MMWRFDSFAVPLTQQSKSSEFMGNGAAFDIYHDNIPGPRIMASPRNLVITILPLAGAGSVAAALRYHARRPSRPLQTKKR
jgi:hypothetical protein